MTEETAATGPWQTGEIPTNLNKPILGRFTYDLSMVPIVLNYNPHPKDEVGYDVGWHESRGANYWEGKVYDGPMPDEWAVINT